MGAAHAGLEDLPFQLPAELADGLGPGSDLGLDYSSPFAPAEEFHFGVRFPRADLQEGKST